MCLFFENNNQFVLSNVSLYASAFCRSLAFECCFVCCVCVCVVLSVLIFSCSLCSCPFSIMLQYVLRWCTVSGLFLFSTLECSLFNCVFACDRPWRRLTGYWQYS